MKKNLYLLILLSGISCSFIQGASLKQVLPIKSVWSLNIYRNGMAGLRFKGAEDTSQIVHLSNVGRAQIRDIGTWEIVKEFENVRFIFPLVNRKIVAVLHGDGAASVIDLENNIIIKKFSNAWMVSFSEGGGHYMKVVFEKSTQLFDTENWSMLREFKDTEPRMLPFSMDEKNVCIARPNGVAQIVSIADGRIVKQFNNISNFGLAFSLDGKYLAVIHNDARAYLIALDTWQIVKEFENIKTLNFSQDGRYMWGRRTDRTLQIIDIHDFHIKFQHTKVIFNGISKNSKYVWFIREDNTAQVVDIETGDVVVENLDDVEECSFYPEGDAIAVALPDEVRVYNLE